MSIKGFGKLGISLTDAEKKAAGPDLVNEGKVDASTVASLWDAEGDMGWLTEIINNLSVAGTASIFNDANLSTSKAVSICEHTNITVSKASSILSHANLSADKAQSILYTMTDYVKQIDIITDGASDKTVSADETLSSGVNRYGTLTVNTGYTLSLDAKPGVIIAREITNNGTVAPTWVYPGGGGCEQGGDGKGGCIFITKTLDIGTVTSNGGNGSGFSDCYGDSSPGTDGVFWIDDADSVSLGGDGEGSVGNKNGGGGGDTGSLNDGYSDGGSASITTYLTVTDIINDLIKAACDWWLVNVAGKTPTSKIDLPDIGGSGGGGGYAYGGSADTAGSGGGGAGSVITVSTDLTAGTANINGGNAPTGGTNDGGGGGGGVAYITYKSSISGTMTFNTSGGTGVYAGNAGFGRTVAL